MKLGVIDYGAGNLQSVCNTFLSLGVQPVLVRCPKEAEGLTHLVLPGVGSFGDCACKLREQGMVPFIKEWVEAQKPFLGICVGYQVLFEGSEESPDVPGLGIFAGKVVKFSPQAQKVPHMGWNSLEIKEKSHPLWKDIESGSYVYYVHSYYPQVASADLVAATSSYGEVFDAAIISGNLVATQFHPEKSQQIGALLLRNFLTL